MKKITYIIFALLGLGGLWLIQDFSHVLACLLGITIAALIILIIEGK